MLPIKESRYLKSIKSGHFSYKRKPDIVKHLNLSQALNKINKSKLAQEIAYCLCTYTHERFTNERYYIAFNSIALSNWDEIAVVQLTPSINSFSDLICVDYKLINNIKFKSENELFFDVLLHELKLLQK